MLAQWPEVCSEAAEDNSDDDAYEIQYLSAEELEASTVSLYLMYVNYRFWIQSWLSGVSGQICRAGLSFSDFAVVSVVFPLLNLNSLELFSVRTGNLSV